MKFLFVNSDYQAFLDDLYGQSLGLENRSYAEQLHARNESLFGAANFYSANLRKLGHEAWDIHFNNLTLQNQWLTEYGTSTLSWKTRLRDAFFPSGSLNRQAVDRYNILAQQIRFYRPDVLVNFAVSEIPPSFLTRFSDRVRLIMAWGEPSSIQRQRDWRGYNLIVCSSECVKNYFSNQGLESYLVRYGFEHTIVDKVRFSPDRTIPVSFIGSLSPLHSARLQWLENLCSVFPEALQVWGPTVDDLPAYSSIRHCYKGRAWGRDAFYAIASSKITINMHSEIEPICADNMRLYEATGLGTFLITDWKQNLANLFEDGHELVSYRSDEECVEQIQYYLEHDEEREAIARAGQQRTLRDHTYYQRMKELVHIVERYLE